MVRELHSRELHPGWEEWIDSITTSGVVNEYPVPNGAGDLAAGPDGKIWLTSGDDTVEEMSTSGVVTNIYTNSAFNDLQDLTAGPDGQMWFTSQEPSPQGSVGSISTDGTGTVTTYTNPYMDKPQGITTGPDGTLWFTDQGNDTIGEITPP